MRVIYLYVRGAAWKLLAARLVFMSRMRVVLLTLTVRASGITVVLFIYVSLCTQLLVNVDFQTIQWSHKPHS